MKKHLFIIFYSKTFRKSNKNFRININKFHSKTKEIKDFPTLTLNPIKEQKPPKSPIKNIKTMAFAKTFSENFQAKSSKNEEKQEKTDIFETQTFDQQMGEPFISIKVNFLTNYKEEPLKPYDIQNLGDVKIEEMMKTGSIDAYSRWINNDGSIIWRLCFIKAFDEEKQLFKIQWKHNNREKKVTRLNLMLKSENQSLFEARREMADHMRYRLLYLESYKKSAFFFYIFY